MGLFRREEKIYTSELSDRIKPIFVDAYHICIEFGFEEGKYFNYRYKDKSIIISHSCLDNGEKVEPFSSGKKVYIVYKGCCVFDCMIKLNGDIKLNVFETGEWTNYFSLLEERRKLTLSARTLLSELYKYGDSLFAIGRGGKVPGVNSYTYSFSDRGISISYDQDLYGSWKYADNEIVVKFDRNEKKNVASAAVIIYKGKKVFDAVHFFPSIHRPHSSNTKCNVYKKGNWEQYLTDAMNNVKKRYGA